MSADNTINLLIVTFASEKERASAVLLANNLKVSLAKEAGLDLSTPYCLNVSKDHLELIFKQGKTLSSVYSDFVKGRLGYRTRKGGGRNQSIARAVGLKNYSLPLSVWDVTAGFGRDAFVLATLGCSVYLIERSPIIGALLLDGLERSKKDEISQKITQLMHLTIEDAKEVIKRAITLKSDKHNVTDASDVIPDVIYLDPMFPEPLRNKSALVKIEMRIVRDIVGDDIDAEELITLSLKLAKKRVVVKRPLQGSTLSKFPPSFVVAGKTHRYDVYIIKTLGKYIQSKDF